MTAWQDYYRRNREKVLAKNKAYHERRKRAKGWTPGRSLDEIAMRDPVVAAGRMPDPPYKAVAA